MDDLNTFLSVRERLIDFLQEDIGTGDITSNNIIPADLKARAEIISKSRLAVVCGLEEASMLFDMCGCDSEILVEEGSKVLKGTAVLNVSGHARAILKAERTVLRSEEHTSELQSRQYLVCRLLLEKKKSVQSLTHVVII